MTNIGIVTNLLNISLGAFGCSREPQMKEPPKTSPATERPSATGNIEINDMDAPNTHWESADWENGGVFNCVWRPGNISFKDSIMSIELKKEENKDYVYISGEYRSKKEYGFGHYEARMKAASGNGLVTSFFVYRGTHGSNDHHEIDIEILGKNPRQMQLNYFVEGKEGKKAVIDLQFDTSKDFHTYGFDWTDKSIEWFVDGKSVYKVEERAPYLPGKIMMNLWPGTQEVSEWLGGTYNGEGTTAEYDWVKYEKAE